MSDLLPIGTAPVESFPDGYRIPGLDRLITAEAAQHAKANGALRFSPAWRILALGFCAERDAATESPAAGLPKQLSGSAPGSGLNPPEAGPGAPMTLIGRVGGAPTGGD